MATTTPNIGLTLPVGTEKVSRQIINQNMSKIDEKVGAVPAGQNLQSQVTSLSDQMANLLQIQSGRESFESADNNGLYSITASNSNTMWVISILPSGPSTNKYATGITNSQTAYAGAFRAYNYDGTPYTGALTVTYFYITKAL